MLVEFERLFVLILGGLWIIYLLSGLINEVTQGNRDRIVADIRRERSEEATGGKTLSLTENS